MTNPLAGILTAVRDYLGSWGTGDKALASLFGRGPTISGVNMTPAAAMNISAVWACVQLIAGNVGSLPLMHYRRKGDRDREQAFDTKLYRLLHDEPNTEMAAPTFFETMQKHVLLEGNAFAEISRDAAGRVASLYPIEPWRVSAVRQNGLSGELLYRIAQRDGKDAILTASEILHVPGLSDNGVWGISVIRHARESFGLTAATEQFGASFFGKGSTFGGILSHPGSMTPQNIDQLRSSLEARHQGVERAHQFIILQGGMKFEPLGIPGRDAQFLQHRQFQLSEIARWFAVPPHMIGDVEKSTCLPADARVFTEQGPRRIAEIRVGDRVWSLDPSRKAFRLARVWRAQRTGHDPILHIEARGRALRANAKHRVLIRRQREYGRWRTAWIPAGEIVPGDYLVGLESLPDGTGQDAPNGRLLTQGFMAFAGLAMGDGTVTKGYVSIARHRKAPYAAAYQAMALEEFRAATMGSRGIAAHRDECEIVWRDYERHMAFSSVTAAQELRELGFSGTAKTKRVPEWVYPLRPDLIRAFLRGYLDSDGAVNTRGWITWSSCQAALLEDVRHLCLAVGVPVGTVRRYAMAGEVELAGRTVHRGDMYQLFAYNVLANRTIGSHHPEKARRLAEARVPQNVIRGVGNDARRSPGPARLNIGGARAFRVDRITTDASEDVWDLGVEGTHTFIADGVVVHNSWGTGITQQTIGFLQFCLRRWLVKWEKELNRKLISPLERNLQFIEFVVDGLERGDQDSRYAAYAIGRQWGWLSVNDVRAYENLPKIEGGDLYLVPVNMTTPEKIEAAPPPGSVPPPERPKPEPEPDEPDEPEEEDDTAERMREFRRDLDEIIEIGKRTLAKPDPAPADLAPIFDQLATLRKELVLTVDERSQHETAAIIEGLQAAQAALEARLAALPTPEPVDLAPIASSVEALQAKHDEAQERAANESTEVRVYVSELLKPLADAHAAEAAARTAVSERIAGMTPYLRHVIEVAVAKVVRVEADRARRSASTPEKLSAWMETFYLTRETVIVEQLLPSMLLRYQFLGRVDEAETETRRIAHAWVEESRQALETLAGDAATLEANVKTLTAHWEAERPKAVADACVTEVIAHV